MRLRTWLLLGGGGAVLLLLLRQKDGIEQVVKMSANAVSDAMAQLRTFLVGKGIEEKVAKAVMQVESGGRPGFVNGSVVIRFEPHLFAGNYKAVTGKELPAAQVPLLPGMAAPTMAEGYKRTGGQAAEWDVMRRAREVNEEAANRSASWGPFQVLGSNFKDSGFTSATQMALKLSTDEAAAYTSWIKFVSNGWAGALLKHMAAKDWLSFAKKYNGPANATTYASKLQAAYEKVA